MREADATHKPEGLRQASPRPQLRPGVARRDAPRPGRSEEAAGLPTSLWVPEQHRTHPGAPKEACRAGGVTHPKGASSGVKPSRTT